MQARHTVRLEAYAPETDALGIEVGDDTFYFVADMAVVESMTNRQTEFEKDSPDPAVIFDLLHTGTRVTHPDLTLNQIKQ